MPDLVRAVYDTGVILQAALNPNGPAAATLRLLDQDLLEVYIALRIRAEVETVLNYSEIRKKHPHLTDAKIAAVLTRIDQNMILIPYTRSHVEYPRDPKDEPLLNLAIEVRADYLVSRDNDLLDLRYSRDFRLLFPFVRLVDPVTFLHAMAQRSSQGSEAEGTPR